VSGGEGRSGDDAEIERQLTEERPLPPASFRGGLRRRLLGPQAPISSRTRDGAYAGSGGLLLALVALGIAGAGPFGA